MQNNITGAVAVLESVDLENLEIEFLLQAVHRCYGYDFSHYAPASFKRRVLGFVDKNGYQHIAELLPKLLRDRAFFNQFLFTISVTVTEMFRDPDFYRSLREEVLPVLKTYPSLRIWVSGCATGEEVYSIAILLQQAGLAERCQIYATDINDLSLQQAKSGIFSIEKIREYTSNYQLSGGTRSFSDYYHCRYESAILTQELRRNITFANHNLVSDGVFGEMHLILCRNVLIYFDKELQNHVLQLFADSLTPHGFLCLGTKESLLFSTVNKQFTEIPKAKHCYQANEHHRPHTPFS